MGPAICRVMSELGWPAMPWQAQVADVAGELIEYDGVRPEYQGLLVPAFRYVDVAVPRQSGKTCLLCAWEVHRAVGWAQILRAAQHIVYSAQTGQDARKKLLEDQFPVFEPRKGRLGISSLRRANGSEGVFWKNGSRLTLMASGDDSGHGQIVDASGKDEMFADVDDRRDQALIPAMATKPAGQVLSISTMGTDLSIPWNRTVDDGRRAVELGSRVGTAYFEWSAPDDVDIDDPATWFGCMPALGLTQDTSVIEAARARMPEGEFRRAFLNQRTSADERLIPVDRWAAICSPALEVAPVAFGVDVAEDRQHAAIVAAGPAGLELVDHKPTTDWLFNRVLEVTVRHNVPVAIDRAGPAGSFAADLERAGVRVVACSGRDFTAACGGFYDAVMNGSTQVRTDIAFDAAVAGAAKRSVGDAWVWARKSSTVDISPLVAATCARWAAADKPAVAELVVL